MRSSATLLAVVCAAIATPCLAADQPDPVVRELFVPFEDLNVVLQAGGRRMFLTRDQYESLLAKAQQETAEPAPRKTTVLGAEYDATIEDGRMRIEGRIVVDVMAAGLQAVPLPIRGVGLRHATLDGKPAALGRPRGGQIVLFVEGQGRHELRLDAVAPVEVAAARQTIRYQLPEGAAGRVRLTVPGDVQLRSGAHLLQRTVDQAAEVTRMQLLAGRGMTELVLTRNNRFAAKERIVVARSVVVDELTETCERLHVTASVKVVRGSIQNVRFAVPDGFEIIDVSTPQISRWSVLRQQDERILDVRLRAPQTETVVLNLSAQRAPAVLQGWTMPNLRPLDTAGSVSVVGLLVQERLELQSLVTTGLIPVETQTLTDMLPSSVFEAEPGAPAVRAVAAFYAPQDPFHLSADLARPAPRVEVTSNTVLVVQDSGLDVHGGMVLRPGAEKLFRCGFTVPAGWDVTQVTGADGKPLAFEPHADAGGRSRILVTLPAAVPPGKTATIRFVATHVPEGWLDRWASREIQFPQFAVIGASSDRGAIAVQVRDDLTLRAAASNDLTPLDENKKAQFHLGGIATALAFRFDHRPFSMAIRVDRTAPRITAETYSMLKIEPGNLRAHYEIVYEIKAARADTLAFLLPTSTPAELAIRGLDNVAIKQSSSEQTPDGRRWTVQLAKAARGTIRLEATFQQRLATVSPAGEIGGEEHPPQRLDLPIVQADQVRYQTGALAIEGSDELEIQLHTKARRVDIGQLAEADYQPGRHLLAACGFAGPPPAAAVDVVRPAGYGVPAAIVERAELVTSVSTNGVSQSVARFRLLTKASFVQVQLPDHSTLWSVYLDAKPAKPQRDGDRVLISLPSADERALRDLQVVYETPVSRLAVWGSLRVPAPRLLLQTSDQSASHELPVADLAWHLQLPAGYRLAQTAGTVYPNLADPLTRRRLARRATPVQRLLEVLLASPSFGLLQTRNARVASVAERYATTDLADGGLSQPMDERLKATEGAEPASDFDREAVTEEPAADAASEPPAEMPADRPAAVPQSEDASAAAKGPAAAKEKKPRPAAATGKLWALGGLRGLKIDLAQQDERLWLESLGADPVLAVTLVDRRRVDLLAWGAALAVLLLGLLLINQTVRARFLLIVTVLVVTTLAPVVTGWHGQMAAAFDVVFAAAVALIPLYAVAGLWRWLAARGSSVSASHAVLMLIVAGLALRAPTPLRADPPETRLGPLTIKIDEPDKPVVVPKDAIIVPYDASQPLDVSKPRRIIVPYEKYVELWNRAYPDQTLTATPPPADYALAGAEWHTTLSDDDFLVLEGQLRLDVYVERPLTVPLPLAGGVLTRAELDGQAARIQVIETAADAGQPPSPSRQASQAVNMVQSQQAESAAPSAVPDAAGRLLALHVTGKGRRQLDLTVRFPLARQSGWRMAQGNIPAAPATALTVIVPQAPTELQLAGITDRRHLETKTAGQPIATALPADGQFRLQWRPKVAQAAVDRSLTVNSDAVMDVQEDRVRVVWRLNLKFPLGQRSSLTLDVPTEYLVERVIGENVRGWQVDQGRVTVALLKAARDQQSLVLQLARPAATDGVDRKTLTAPVVRVPDAALHEGRITVRRSPLLELRVLRTDGLTRTHPGAPDPSADATDSPLGIEPFQAFRFARTPFVLDLSAATMPPRVTARTESVLRLSETERTLESRVVLRVERRAIYRLQLQLPPQVRVQEVLAPEPFQWSVQTVVKSQLLSVLLARGQQGEFSVVLRATLGQHGSVPVVPLPRIVVRDVARQPSMIVMQTDPGFDVRVEQLRGCQTVLLQQTYGWLDSAQRELARAAIRAESSDFSGQVRLIKKTPRIRCQTVSNLHVTDRAFEQTILLDFSIQEAGVREVSFLLPVALRDASVTVPLLRQKIVEDVDQATVRVRLRLQGEVMGQLRVLIKNDRLLTSQAQSVPIPAVETGRTLRQFVALESAGRDEVLVQQRKGLEPLGRQQQQWRKLAEMLGPGITHAFLVQPGATDPLLVVHTKDRQAVQTVGARIAMAQTVLTVDASGAYRGVQVYQVDNRTEQFLEISLPAGATLWTAEVAGQPVKPIATQRGFVRVPLVKTAEGDQDYPVRLKYGGRIDVPRQWAAVHFPLLHTENINVEQSQVRLWLPQTHRWLDFRGSMRLVTDEQDLAAGYVKYKTEQLRRMAAGVTSANPYARLRATQNLKQLAGELRRYEQLSRRGGNRRLRQELDSSDMVLQRAAELVAKQDQAQVVESAPGDNRDRLNTYFQRQSSSISRNIVNEQVENFSTVTQAGQRGNRKEAKAGAGQAGQILRGWVDANRLTSDQKANVARARSRIDLSAIMEEEEGKRARERRATAERHYVPDLGGEQTGLGLSNKTSTAATTRDSRRDQQSRLYRFQQRLQEKQQQQMQGQQPTGGPSDALGRTVGPSGRVQLGVPVQVLGKPQRRAGQNANEPQLPPAPAAQVAVPSLRSADRGVGTGQLAPTAAPLATGLASLDVRLPQRGVAYLFTTPRGDIEIEARAVAVTLLDKLSRMAWAIGLVVVMGSTYRLLRYRRLSDVIGRVTATVLIVAGLVLLLLGLVPLLALAAIILGAVQHVRLYNVA